MLSSVMLLVTYARYDECHTDECRYVECRGAVWGVT
jgi:hypothetical protein